MNLNGIRIAVDIDGCIADHDNLFCQRHNAIVIPMGLDSIGTRQLVDYDSKQLRNVKAQIFTNEYWAELPLVEHVKEVFGILTAAGCKIDLFTARPEGAREYTLQWLRKNGIWELIHTWYSDMSAVDRAVAAHSYHVFVDDA